MSDHAPDAGKRDAAAPGFLARVFVTEWPLALVMALSFLPVSIGSLWVFYAVERVGEARAAGWYLRDCLFVYGFTPLVIASAGLLLLAPGMLLAASGRRATPSPRGRVVLHGFALSLPIVSVAARAGATDFRFVEVLLALTAAAWVVRAWRLRRTRATILAHKVVEEAAVLVAPALLFIVAFFPKFFWEALNPDGGHAFEVGRLALRQLVPFWPADAGPIQAFPTLTSVLFAWPQAWFMRLFGENEAASRLPFALYLVLLVAGIRALAEHVVGGVAGAAPAVTRRLRVGSTLVIWVGVAVYAVVMSFSATYSPYSADIALPATQDTLLLVTFIGFVLAFVRGERAWAAFFVVLTFLGVPSGALLMALWLAAAVLFMRPRPWRMIATTMAALAVCVLWNKYAAQIHGALGLPVPGAEYDKDGQLARFKQLAFTQWNRWLFAIVPGGILPFFTVLAWRRLDSIARATLFVGYAYFAFFYVQAYVSLHHFVPAMLLPLVAFWRFAAGSPALRALTLAALAAAVTALALSWPPSVAPDQTARDIGRTIVDLRDRDLYSGPDGGDSKLVTIEDYSSWEMGPRASQWDPGRLSMRAYRTGPLLHHLFPYDFDPAVPTQSLGGSWMVWDHYAAHITPMPSQPGGYQPPLDGAQYLLTWASDAVPTGWRVVARLEDDVVLVRSEAVLAADRARRPPTPVGARIYVIDRPWLFPKRPDEAPAGVIVVKALLQRLGIVKG